TLKILNLGSCSPPHNEQVDRLIGVAFMKNSTPVSANWICVVPAFFLLASASVGFAKAQKKSTPSNQQKPEAILSAAKKFADAKAWSVQAHVTADKDMKISGIIFGKDFDLTVETVDGTTRQIALGDKSWSSDDGGKSWKESKEIDRRFYYLMHTPMKYRRTKRFRRLRRSAQRSWETNLY